MKLGTLNRFFRWFGLVLVVDVDDDGVEPPLLRFERASRWPLIERKPDVNST